MKMFSDCSGECDDCHISYTGVCLAGHGDDDFYPITRESAIKMIKEKKIEKYQIERLKKKFNL